MPNDGVDPTPPSVTYEADASTPATGRYAYSPLGNTGLMRADLPSDVKASYEGYTYATAADLTIYGGDLTIKIDWSEDDVETTDMAGTSIEVMISDLTDSDGMGWTDSDRMDGTEGKIVASITFDNQDGSKLASFLTEEYVKNTLSTGGLIEIEDVGNGDMTIPLNVAGFRKDYDGGENYDQVIKLVYDDDSEVYADGAISGQFLGVSAADSGNADQPRAIIGEWNIGLIRLVETDTWRVIAR